MFSFVYISFNNESDPMSGEKISINSGASGMTLNDAENRNPSKINSKPFSIYAKICHCLIMILILWFWYPFINIIKSYMANIFYDKNNKDKRSKKKM